MTATWMHEFHGCQELRDDFIKIRKCIQRHWNIEMNDEREWKRVWFFGFLEKKKDINGNGLNMFLSFAKYSVK